MAHLSKDEYSRRNEAAAKRMLDNASNSSMTELQHAEISSLCRIRHEIHSNMDSITKFDEYGKKQELVSVNVQIERSGLKPMPFIPTSLEGFIDIDDMRELKETDLFAPDDDDADYQTWYDDNYERIHNELSELNSEIEKYLLDIDRIYKTNYAPTGAQRIF